MQCVYWVITMKCNDFCSHCYNNSGPEGEVIDKEELLKVIPNLPKNMQRIVLSGGEPLMELGKLLAVINGIRARFGPRLPIWIQTNGDLLTKKTLSLILEAGVSRVDITSLDRFHQHQGSRRETIETLFKSFNLVDAKKEPHNSHRSYAFWGANDDIWLGGNWARGRALKNGLAYKNPEHNFCSLWSGAQHFLDSGSARQEVHIQLHRVYPCCPTTYFAIGDARKESVASILAKTAEIPQYQALNRGDISGIGLGQKTNEVSREFAVQRIQELGDVCLWCDEYFSKHYAGPRGEASPKR